MSQLTHYLFCLDADDGSFVYVTVNKGDSIFIAWSFMMASYDEHYDELRYLGKYDDDDDVMYVGEYENEEDILKLEDEDDSVTNIDHFSYDEYCEYKTKNPTCEHFLKRLMW
jgi:hypothetical protein